MYGFYDLTSLLVEGKWGDKYSRIFPNFKLPGFSSVKFSWIFNVQFNRFVRNSHDASNFLIHQTRIESSVQKPNSWMYTFVEVSVYNLESSQTWGFHMAHTLFASQTRFKARLLGGGGGGEKIFVG